ncbi:hypothetical protein B0T19DRAFT_444948 [Cercophora scortea]|uniref:Uncharacterized protein n=1 Tax=Cercophora scortea TaxID=314031 RepID=A0AAE0M7V5_9PEZI|nr:hypothetical protein B0T19DRAFT_444948 [Cercophora scortea]
MPAHSSNSASPPRAEIEASESSSPQLEEFQAAPLRHGNILALIPSRTRTPKESRKAMKKEIDRIMQPFSQTS